jgi:anti-anti-sigma factor
VKGPRLVSSAAGAPNDGSSPPRPRRRDGSRRAEAAGSEGLAHAVERTAEGVRLAFSGDLDLASARDFEERLEEAIQARPATITLDLRGLGFLDSRGLRSILGAQELCEQAGCRMIVIPGESARRLFELTGISERLSLADESSSGQAAD